MTTNTKPALALLADTIRRIDDAMDQVENTERMALDAKRDFQAKQEEAKQLFFKASEEARARGKELPLEYHYCRTLVRFCEEDGLVTATRLSVASPFDLDRMSEMDPTPESNDQPEQGSSK